MNVTTRTTLIGMNILCTQTEASAASKNRIFNCNFIGTVEWTSSLSSFASFVFPSRQSPSEKGENDHHNNKLLLSGNPKKRPNFEVSPLTRFHWAPLGANHIREHRELAQFRSRGLIVNWSVMEASAVC